MKVTDSNNSTATDSLDVTIIDDKPSAVSDTNSLGTAAVGSHASGNLIAGTISSGTGTGGADKQGADGAHIGGVTSGVSDGNGGFNVTGTYGTLHIDANGNYDYTRTSNSGGTDTFHYTLTDSDGDVSNQANLTISLTATAQLFVGSNDSDDNPSDPAHFVDTSPNVRGVINGSAGDDTIVGDPGATPTISAGSSANVVLVLDTTASLSAQQMTAMQQAVGALLQSLYNSGAANVRVSMYAFGGGYTQLGTYNIVTNSHANAAADAAALASALDAANADGSITNSGNRLYIGADPGSNTSYADGLDAVIDYLTPGTSGSDPVSSVPLTGASVNKVIFISDGEPTTNATQTQINTITGTGAGQYGYTIEAVGLNVAGSPNAVAALNALDSGHSYTNVVNPSDLTGVVGSLAGSGVVQSAAGNDIINGGAGKDIIYGDVMNTDVLRAAAGLSAATYPAGSGWAVFAGLEGTNSVLDPAGNGAQWTRADTLAYIASHQRELATESGRTGGNDTITAGTGDDIIFAQEGNDKINYAQGDGQDTVDGGTGSDTLYITGATGTVTIAAATGGTDIVPATGPNSTDIIVTMSDGGSIRMDSVEDIDITAGPGGVNIQYIGSLASTALDTSTVTVHGGTGDDILDLTQRGNTDPHKVIADGGAQTTADIVKLDFSISEITAIEAISGGVKITHAGGSGTITDEFTNFESFQFEGGVTKTLAQVLAIDLIPPTLTSITINDTALKIGETATVSVVFSEKVSNLEITDFTAQNGTLSNLSTSDGGQTWTMTLAPVNGNVSSGNQVSLTGSYTDVAGNTGTGGASSTTYAVDTVAPTVTSIVTQTPSVSTTNADSLIFRVAFSEAVSGVDATDFTVSGTTAGISVAAVAGSGGTQYDVTVSGGNLANLNGAVSLAFAGGQNITDAAGNALVNTTPTGTDNHTYTVDNTAPTVSNLVVTDTNIQFDVSEAVTVTGNGTSTVTNASNHITVTPSATGTSSIVVLTDAAGNAANAFGLYVGTSGNNGSSGTPISAPLANGTNVMYGYAGIDFLTGGNGVDYIFGGDGADTIDGNGGADKLSGGAGNDNLQLANGDWVAGESIDGGADSDTITLTNGTTVDFTSGTISSVETLNGSSSVDSVTMSAQQWAALSTINLNGSNDTLTVKVDGAVDISGASSTTVSSAETRNVEGGNNNDTLTISALQLANLIGGTSNKIDLGGGTDTIILSNATTADLSGVTITSVENLKGSSSNDSITLTAAQLAALASLDLGGGTGDTLTLTTAPTNNLSNVTNVETIVLAGATTSVTTVDGLVASGATLTINGSALSSSQTLTWNGAAETNGAFNITGGAGNDVITGGAQNDAITAGTGNDNLSGGDGDDTFALAGNLTNSDIINGGADNDTLTFTGSTSNTTALNNVTNVETIVLGNASTSITTVDGLVAAGQTLTVDGSALTSGSVLTWNGAAETNGKFIITGGAGNDVITGGAGNDVIIGGAGNDTINGVGGSDIIKFATTGALNGSDILTITAGSGGDILNFGAFLGSGSVLQNGASGTGINAYTSASSGNANITDKVALYSDATENNVDDTTSIAGIINSNVFSINAGGKAILLTGSTSGAYETRIWYINDANNNGTIAAGEVTLVGTTSGNFDLDSLTTANFAFTADPIVLDLDHNGFAFTSSADGVQFDINSDGVKDQIAWTSNGHDGLLALDVNGNGKIDNGSELFTPTFAGGNFTDALAALASLDSNHDGVIDSKDQAFAQLSVWQDANHNGVTDAGEMRSLTGLGITGINLDAAAGTGTIDGQSVAAKGIFTYADGSTGSFVEVDFDTSLAEVADNGGHTLSGTNGVADTFALPASTLGHADTILNFNNAEGDKIDLSALLDQVFAPSSNVEKFIHLAQSGNDVTVQVDTTGQGNFAGGSHDVAVLAGFAGTSHGDIINATFAGTEHQLHLAATT
ncbi:Ig-like domain-containing protein [Afipia sp. DC4300-2b1]|uniref:Ig-like domain-containing protein n=1 Tax=Afipia sp. DC4300-2b1 TaxID=2804672 RepID=UPI003CF61324